MVITEVSAFLFLDCEYKPMCCQRQKEAGMAKTKELFAQLLYVCKACKRGRCQFSDQEKSSCWPWDFWIIFGRAYGYYENRIYGKIIKQTLLMDWLNEIYRNIENVTIKLIHIEMV